MEDAKLKELIAELRTRLDAAENLSDEERQGMDETLARVETLLESGEESMTDQVTRMASDFEADHPQAARILENVADTLSKLGI